MSVRFDFAELAWKAHLPLGTAVYSGRVFEAAKFALCAGLVVDWWTASSAPETAQKTYASLRQRRLTAFANEAYRRIKVVH